MQWSTPTDQLPLLRAPTKGLSTPGLSLHLGENAIGITNKVASKITATPCVNGVDSLASYILTTL